MLLTLIVGATSLTLECEFIDMDFSDHDFKYTCLVENIFIRKHNTSITSVNGTHIDNNTNIDVLQLQINEQNITYLPKEIASFFPSLKNFIVYLTSLEFLEKSDFKHFLFLEILSLTENKIATIPENTFDDLDSLKELYLSGNRIENLYLNVFAKLVNLEIIYLSNNFIQMLPAGLFEHNTQLTTMSFQFNNIMTVGMDLFKSLKDLKTLWFNGNKCIDNSVLDNDNNLFALKEEIYEKCEDLSNFKVESTNFYMYNYFEDDVEDTNDSTDYINPLKEYNAAKSNYNYYIKVIIFSLQYLLIIL